MVGRGRGGSGFGTVVEQRAPDGGPGEAAAMAEAEAAELREGGREEALGTRVGLTERGTASA